MMDLLVHSLFQSQDDGRIPISAKQLELRQIGVDQAMRLNEQWHSRLPKTQKGNLTRNKRYIFFGAEFGNRWYASAIWTSPVSRAFNKFPWLELRRFAISPEAPKNTATYLLAKMTKTIREAMPEVTRFISYQDTEVHRGTIYKAANWTPVAKVKFATWNKSRKRNPDQATGDKVRWEWIIKEDE